MTAGFYYPRKEKNSPGKTIWEKEKGVSLRQAFEIPPPPFTGKVINFNKANQNDLLNLDFDNTTVKRKEFQVLLKWWIEIGGKNLGSFNSPQQLKARTMKEIEKVNKKNMDDFEEKLKILVEDKLITFGG